MPADSSVALPPACPHPPDMSAPPPKPKILIVLHQETSSPGKLGHMLKAKGFQLDIRKPRFGDTLPDTMAEHAGAVIFGGPMSANDEHEFVCREIDWMAVPLGERKPLLGICLGMQLLFDYQEEGDTQGLNLLGGAVASLPPTRKVPHMGWNKVAPEPGSPIGPGDYFYFVHSYIVRPERPSDVAATTDYGITFPSVVIRDTIWGTQFHPEKSGESGLALVRAWLAGDAAQSADAA